MSYSINTYQKKFDLHYVYILGCFFSYFGIFLLPKRLFSITIFKFGAIWYACVKFSRCGSGGVVVLLQKAKSDVKGQPEQPESKGERKLTSITHHLSYLWAERKCVEPPLAHPRAKTLRQGCLSHISNPYTHQNMDKKCAGPIVSLMTT